MAIADPPTPADEILDFLISAPTPEQIIALRPSPAMQARLAYLLEQNREARLTDHELQELEAYLQLDQFVRRLKIRAKKLRL
jgi:hypothetical protein